MQKSLRIALAELTLISVLIQIFFGSISSTYASDGDLPLPNPTPPSDISTPSAPNQDLEPSDEILVQFKTDIDTTMGQYQVDSVESQNGLQTTDTITENNIAIMKIEDSSTANIFSQVGTTTERANTKEDIISQKIEDLKKDPRIAHVQKNFFYDLQSINDPLYAEQWSLDNAGQIVSGETLPGTPDADIDYPEAMEYASGKLGTGVIVAVLDSGVAYAHPDLVDNLWDGSNCLSDTGVYLGGCKYGYDFSDDDKDPFYGSYASTHGTHVSGIIGATANNGTGVIGVSPRVKLMQLQIFGGGKSRASTYSVIRAINFAKYNGAKVINASFGGGNFTPQELVSFDLLTYEAIRDFPGLFIAAAGNDGNDSDTGLYYPAGFGTTVTVSGESISGESPPQLTFSGLVNVISVAATDHDDNLASFSNYGAHSVHIGAPGVSIINTVPQIHTTLISISGEQGWNVSGNSHTGVFNIVSGETQVRTDDRNPYVSGESAMLSKIFSNSGYAHTNLASIPVWCNSPWDDYMTIETTDGIGFSTGRITNILQYTSQYSQFGHTGTLWYAGSNMFSTPGSFTVGFGWYTDNTDDIDPDTGTPYAGCSLMGPFFLEQSTDGEDGIYGKLSGTSMAAPHVAGAVALAWAYRPNATIEQIRDAILNSGDTKPQLISRVETGKRLNIFNMLKYLDYLDNPIPTSSPSSKVYKDAFTFTISGESNFYNAQRENKIYYEIYNGDVFAVSGATYSMNYSISGGTTRIDYKGVGPAGDLTAMQTRTFVYDNTAPVLSENVTNSIGGVFTGSQSVQSSLEIKNANIAPLSLSRLSSFASFEIGRFALTAHGESVRTQKVEFHAITVGTGLTIEAIASYSSGISLYDIAGNTLISATASISGNTITFDNINVVIPQDTTHNYGVILTLGNVANYVGDTINIGSPSVMAVRDSDSTSIVPTGVAVMKTYTFGITSPSVVINAVPLASNNAIARITVTNNDTNTGITLSGVQLGVAYRSTVNGNGLIFNGQVCLSDSIMLDNGASCGTPGTSAPVPFTQSGFLATLSLSNTNAGSITLARNGGNVTFYVYNNTSAPWYADDIVATTLRSLTYIVGTTSSTEDYTCLSAISMRGSVSPIGNVCNYIAPSSSTGSTSTGVTIAGDLYFVTGSLANLYLNHFDDTARFGNSGVTLLTPDLSLANTYFSTAINSSNYEQTLEISGDLSLTSGKNDYAYSIIDIAENTTANAFSVYRLPNITNLTLGYTGTTMYASFDSDISTPVEFSYVQYGYSGSSTMTAQTGRNNFILSGIIMTGTLSATIGIPKILSDITLPDTVYDALRQNTSYTFDTVPDTISFTRKVAINPGAQVQYGPVTLTGFNMPITIRTTKGTLDVDGQLFGTAATTVYPGSVISIYIQAPSTYNSVLSGALLIGSGIISTFELETSLAVTVPPVVQIGAGGGGGGGTVGGVPLSPGTSSTPTGGATFSNGVSTPLSSFAPGIRFTQLFQTNTPSKAPSTITVEIPKKVTPQTLTQSARESIVSPLQESITSLDSLEAKQEVCDRLILDLTEKISDTPRGTERRILVIARNQVKKLKKSLDD